MKNTVNKRLLTTIIVGILLISQLIVPITSYGLSFGGMKGDADNFINKGTNGQKITLQEAITKLVPIGNVIALVYGAVGIFTIVVNIMNNILS